MFPLKFSPCAVVRPSLQKGHSLTCSLWTNAWSKASEQVLCIISEVQKRKTLSNYIRPRISNGALEKDKRKASDPPAHMQLLKLPIKMVRNSKLCEIMQSNWCIAVDLSLGIDGGKWENNARRHTAPRRATRATATVYRSCLFPVCFENLIRAKNRALYM